MILSGERLDERLGLGDASPIWLRFETEAPVDDLLLATTDDGFVAIQAKTSATLSPEPRSPFARTIEQFVRHWLTCRSGDGALGWDRPLDPLRDRLVLAVGPQAAASVRVDLPAALRIFVQPGGGYLNQDQQRAFKVFETCTQTAWASVTAEAFDSAILTDLARLIVVFTVDLDGADATASAAILANALPEQVNATTVLSLLRDICGRLMARRGGGDLATFRQELAACGVCLGAPPRYQADIKALCLHSAVVAESLKQYEAIESQTGMPITLKRDCQAEIEAAALIGPLLVIGEPGAGKSGVLNALARSLRFQGQDVLELAVDRYSVETLEGLAKELHLEHGLLEVLNAWDGPGPGWLIIDALDATRGGKGEGVFRTLIERVLEQSGRWRVIASIRSFDLRLGQRFRQLFKGTPPVKYLSDPGFGDVRHVQVPRWSDDEFDQLLARAPTLASALKQAPAHLRDLAKVPFNTRLLSELIAQGQLDLTLTQVSSQVELLRFYWQHRIEGHGLTAKACLKMVVQSMIAARTLRAPTLDIGADPAMIDTLSHEGVLIRGEGDRWVQFRHHLLFDFAASQVFLDPDRLVSGTLRFPKEEARGLMLTPALGFVLREIWDSEADHSRFWMAVSHLVADQAGDPIIRSAAGRIGSEHPVAPEDALWLAARVAAGDDLAITALTHVCGALAVRIEDDGEIQLVSWIKLASALAPSVAKVAGTLRFLLHLLIDRVKGEPLRADIGQAGRALLVHGLTLAEPGVTVTSAIGFVVDTFGTDPEGSRGLLHRLFEPERLNIFGPEEVPVLCHKIKMIGDLDPQFVAQVFVHVYDHEVIEERQTRLGFSQILPLTSNARQDYDMARYSLSEYFPQFLERHPGPAIEAVIGAVKGYWARSQPKSDASEYRLTVDSRPIRLRPDHSYIWAHDPDSTYSQDAELLILKLLQRLRTAPESEALVLTRLLRDKASLAVFWSRLFMAAAERGGVMADELWTIATHEQFLISADTRKDAIDLVSKGVTRRSEAERLCFEESVIGFDFSQFRHPAEAREAFLHRLFTSIGRENLRTEAAREVLEPVNEEAPKTNDRLFVCQISSSKISPYPWMTEQDREVQTNTELIKIMEIANSVLGLNVGDKPAEDLPLDRALGVLEAVRDSLAPGNIHPILRIFAEGTIGQGCTRIVTRKWLPLLADIDPISDPTLRFVDLLRLAARSKGPAADAKAEAEFESNASWGSPSPRVDAAESTFDLILQRPDLYQELKPEVEGLLADPHPAVRLQAALRLACCWDIDREGFWIFLNERCAQEANLGVVEHVVGDLVHRVLHADPLRTFMAIQVLLARKEGTPEREQRLRIMVSSHLSVLWVSHHLDESNKIIIEWIAKPAAYSKELHRVIFTLRNALVMGLTDIKDKDAALRGRAVALVSNIVDAANRELAIFHTRPEPSESQIADARETAQLVDVACRELLFSTGINQPELDPKGLRAFLSETAPLLQCIGDYATPHTIYHLLQLLERLIPINPGQVFDLAAHALRCGKRSGFQYESMGIDLLVKLIGVLLADHREIFEVSDRRARLIDSLEIFMEAGWPAARRLLYRLPDLIQ